MATVGISFGSASSGAGFDVTSTVTSILALSSAVETPWKAQLSKLQAQDSAFTALGTNLASLSSALSSLTNFDGLFASKQGSSSDTGVLTLTAASTSATAGSHTVTVSSLASTSSKYSESIASGDVLSGSLTLQIGSGQGKTITLDSSSNTLASLASAINTGNYGVSANVVTDTHGSRLSLVSSTSGAAGQITLSANLSDTTTGASVAFSTGQNGADAQLTVDGLATTSASNTVSGAIPGVTFQLLSANQGSSSVQVQITNDNTSLETAVQSLATAYNAVVHSIKTQEGKDSSGNAEPLFGDPTLALVQGQLASALLGGSASGAISNLAQLGLSVGQDGTLTLDASTLDATLNAHFNDVAGYFQSAGGFGQTLSATLNGLGSSNTNGAIALALSQNSTVETGIDQDISDEDARLALQKTKLTAELNTANQILQSIPSQLNQVDELYSALTGYNTGSH